MPARNQLAEILLVPGDKFLPALGFEYGTGIWAEPETVPQVHSAVTLGVFAIEGLRVSLDRVAIAHATSIAGYLTAGGGIGITAPISTGSPTHVAVFDSNPTLNATFKGMTLAAFAAFMPPGPKGDKGDDGTDGTNGLPGGPGPAGPGLPAGGSDGQLIKKSGGTSYVTEWFTHSFVTGSGTGVAQTLPVYTGTNSVTLSRIKNPPIDGAGQLYGYRARADTLAGEWEVLSLGGGGTITGGGTPNTLALWNTGTNIVSLNNVGGGFILRSGAPPQWGSLDFGELIGKPDTLAGYGITDAFTKTQTIAAINAAFPITGQSKPEGGVWASGDRAVFQTDLGWIVNPNGWMPTKPTAPGPYVLVIDSGGNATWRMLVGTNVLVVVT